jgi:hypothetical protein
MTNRRSFLKNTVQTIAASGLAYLPSQLNAAEAKTIKSNKYKYWGWVNPDHKESVDVLKARYKKYESVGFKGILFEADSQKHFEEAKQNGLEAHRWNWTMNNGAVKLLKEHPEWYAISRSGNSCATKPPYVDYYRWLCPSKPEVLNFLMEEADAILSKKYIDGLHLDYIRFSDVILPLNLWSDYKLVQQTELPDYDFCYCKTCRDKYQAQTGKDPLDLKFPDAQVSWRTFRYRAINDVVNSLATVAKSHNKQITAAVFPTPEIARRIVRQDWTNWNLDAVFPMIYHKFYQEEATWIGEAVTEGVHFLNGRFPLYAGLYLPDFNNNMTELEMAIHLAIKNKAAGVSLFGNIDDKVLATLQMASNNH